MCGDHASLRAFNLGSRRQVFVAPCAPRFEIWRKHDLVLKHLFHSSTFAAHMHTHGPHVSDLVCVCVSHYFAHNLWLCSSRFVCVGFLQHPPSFSLVHLVLKHQERVASLAAPSEPGGFPVASGEARSHWDHNLLLSTPIHTNTNT